MIHFEGDRAFARPFSATCAKLSDAAWLVGCLSEAKVTEASANRAAWKLKPKLSFLTGSLDTVLEVTGRETGKSASFKIVTRAIGATSTVTATLHFTEGELGGAAIHWVGELVQVTGLLKMVPKGLLQGTAEKVIEDVWAAVTAKLMAEN